MPSLFDGCAGWHYASRRCPSLTSSGPEAASLHPQSRLLFMLSNAMCAMLSNFVLCGTSWIHLGWCVSQSQQQQELQSRLINLPCLACGSLPRPAFCLGHGKHSMLAVAKQELNAGARLRTRKAENGHSAEERLRVLRSASQVRANGHQHKQGKEHTHHTLTDHPR